MKVKDGLFPLIFLSTIILSGCGGGNSKIATTFSTSAALTEARDLTTGERNIATRICYAYQSKSQKLRGSGFIGHHFFFNTNKTDCAKQSVKRIFDTTLQYNTANELVFFPGYLDSTQKFFSTVQTDTTGYLSQLCQKIFNNRPVSNTLTQGNFTVQITFTREDLDGYFLQYFIGSQSVVNGNKVTTYKIDSAEKFKVRTQIDFTTGKILGMDEYYTSQKVCLNGDAAPYSTYEQVYDYNPVTGGSE